MVEKLMNPPIEEVICSFTFKDSCDDLTFYGILHEEIKDLFPLKNRSVYNDFMFEEIDDKITPKPVEIVVQQFLNKSKATYIDVSSNQLAVHKKKPYGKWEDFLPIIKTSFNKYTKTTKLKELNRLILVYKNEIFFNTEEIDIEEFFKFRPYFVNELGHAAGPMITGVSFPKNGMNDFLRITLASNEPPKDIKHSFSLQLEYFSINPDSVSIDSAIDWAENAHSELNKAFGYCLTEKLLQEFDK